MLVLKIADSWSSSVEESELDFGESIATVWMISWMDIKSKRDFFGLNSIAISLSLFRYRVGSLTLYNAISI